jgi:translocation protein SEC72
MVPPPPNVPYPNQAEIIKDLREKGNVSSIRSWLPDAMLLIADVFAFTKSEFKAGRLAPAIDLYTESIKRSFQRPPWEMTNFCKEEITSALLNRSAAFAAQKNWYAAFGVGFARWPLRWSS